MYVVNRAGDTGLLDWIWKHAVTVMSFTQVTETGKCSIGVGELTIRLLLEARYWNEAQCIIKD